MAPYKAQQSESRFTKLDRIEGGKLSAELDRHEHLKQLITLGEQIELFYKTMKKAQQKLFRSGFIKTATDATLRRKESGDQFSKNLAVLINETSRNFAFLNGKADAVVAELEVSKMPT